MPRINQWSKTYYPEGRNEVFMAPETRIVCLQGFIVGREGIDPSVISCTSGLRGKRGENVVTESGTEYELGDIHPEYEAKFPNARVRLLESLKEMP